MADDRKLRIQQEMFCQEYVQDFNGTRAAIAAGYSKRTAQEQASRLLSNVMVQQKVDELLAYKIKAINITQQKVLSEMYDIAFSDVEAAFNEDGSLKPISQIPVALRKAISSIEVDELFEGTGRDRTQIGYTKKIKLWPKDKAHDQLGRYLKMFIDRVEHSGKIKLEDIIAGTSDVDKSVDDVDKGEPTKNETD